MPEQGLQTFYFITQDRSPETLTREKRPQDVKQIHPSPKTPNFIEETDNRRNIESCFGKDTFYRLAPMIIKRKAYVSLLIFPLTLLVRYGIRGIPHRQ